MQFDFETILERRGHDAIAVDAAGSELFRHIAPREGMDPIPMWVADMNFPAAPSVQRAIAERLSHPSFGYFNPRQEYFDAIIGWQQRRNGVEGLLPAHIGYENGVLGGLSSAMRVICSRGDHVLLHSPTYIGFTHVLEDNGYRMELSPLKQDENGVWRMDFADMERRIVEKQIHAAVFCSPHNPTGRVWERWEIERAMELFRKYDVTVISDEIWSDLTRPGFRHIPTQSISDDARNRTVALYAPSKTFNLAGLVGSYHIIYNRLLRERIEKESAMTHYKSMNVLSMYALIGAYSAEGEQWLEELRQVLDGNIRCAVDFLRAHVPGICLSEPQGTYMLFPDFSDWLRDKGMSLDDLLEAGWREGVLWQDGRPFHGESAIRINLALPKSRVEEAMERLNRAVFSR